MVEREMIEKKDDLGNPFFEPNERMTEQDIRAFFSRMTQRHRRMQLQSLMITTLLETWKLSSNESCQGLHQVISPHLRLFISMFLPKLELFQLNEQNLRSLRD